MVTFDQVRRAIEGVLVRHLPAEGDRKDSHFYTPAEWAASERKYDRGSILVMTMEGPANLVLNGYLPSEGVWADLTAALKDVGCYAEYGYSWSVHVYLIR